MADDEEPKAGVSWIQVAGSALAAVSSAVVLSTLGVAGTVIGAALGSVVATVATALYTRTLDASRQQVASQAAALRRVTRARSELDEAVAARRRGEAVSATGIARAERELDAAEEVLATDTGGEPAAAGPGSGARPAGLPSALLARLSWKRVAVVAAAVFLAAMVTITAFEVVAGRAVSELTGGSDTPTRSTVPGLGRDRPEPTPSDRAPEDPDASEPPTDSTTEETPSDDASTDESEEPTPAEPTVDPSATPSPTPSPSPSPSPGLTEAPTVAPSATG